MCGIVGYVGPDEALPIVLAGLRRLEYRGYDSAGVAVLADGELAVRKRAGKLAELEAALADDPAPAGTAAVGHTRWATHGAPTDRNAHPHTDCTGRIAVIHNGIVENHAELRQQLEKSGHTLGSETDTEVVAHLLEDELGDGSLTDAVRAVVGRLRGAYALVVLAADRPDELVGVKVSSPLIVGLGEGETILASDIPAVLERTRTVVPLDEGRIATITPRGLALSDLEGAVVPVEPMQVDWDVAAAQKGGYDFFMRKEIDEQPAAIRNTLAGRTVRGRLVLDELRMSDEVLRDVSKVFVVACGTAFHSGLVAKYAIEHWTRLPVEIEIASEFRYRDPVLGPDTLTLAVSQSGETIDTLEAARHAARQGSHVIAVTNTVGSSLAREAEGVLYMHAGPEIGVAASKTFATQMVSQYLVALHLAQARGTMFPEEVRGVLAELEGLPAKVERAIGLEPQTLAIARELRDAHDVLFIGRHTGYPAALEGALKLKELSYQHAEGYPAGELKHGPIALVEDGVPVVAVATRCHVYPKMLSNIAEVKARGARVIAVVTEGDTEAAALADHVLEVPETTELLSPVVVTVPLQLLAYHLADLRGCDVDRPRNLAKSVTVE
ncbi:MAG TPA: glutamine--fructose-6-phosphate transaminase (isomerizing) [Actinomycetota bacterium]|nr:glutamine--fructose-6-phosphate transaminase (isomerizing) [Actinomycetota bacterium]